MKHPTIIVALFMLLPAPAWASCARGYECHMEGRFEVCTPNPICGGGALDGNVRQPYDYDPGHGDPRGYRGQRWPTDPRNRDGDFSDEDD